MNQTNHVKSTVLIILFILVISYSYIPLRGIVSALLLDLIGYAYHHLKFFRVFYLFYPWLSGLLTAIVVGGVLGLPFGAMFKKKTIPYSFLVSFLSSLWITKKLQEFTVDAQYPLGYELPNVQFLDLLNDFYIDFTFFVLVFVLCCSLGARAYQRLTTGVAAEKPAAPLNR